MIYFNSPWHIPSFQVLSAELQEADQIEGATQFDTVAASLGSHFILKHKDKEVRAYAACCLADILRIYAPDAPYDSDQLRVNDRFSSGKFTNFDMLFLVMGFISLVDEIKFMLISSSHICIRSITLLWVSHV